MHINNKELYYEIVVSKARGKLTRRSVKMLEILGTEAIKKMNKRFFTEDDKMDCFQMGLLKMYQNWYNFNQEKSENAFAYFTEIFKRALTEQFNVLYKKKGDPDNNIKLISIQGSNDGQGLHSI